MEQTGLFHVHSGFHIFYNIQRENKLTNCSYGLSTAANSCTAHMC